MSRHSRFAKAVAAVVLVNGPVCLAQLQPVWEISTSRVTMSPLRVVDVDGDGVDDVVLATMGPIGDPFSSGTVRVLNADGSVQSGWPVTIDQPISGAALAIGDLDGDGDREIVAESWFSVHVWNHDGSTFPGWPKATGTSSTASPALADLDGDGDLEIIAPSGSTMHVWHHDGTEAAGWPRSASETFQAAAVGDIDGDGTVEIVAGTWRPQFPDAVPFELRAWDVNGQAVPGFPVGNLGSIRGPVCLGDVDDDDQIEIVVRAGDTLYVFDGQGQTEPPWPVTPGGPIRNATPSLGDLDGDGDLEIITAGFDVWAYHHDGTLVSGWPVDVNATFNVNSGPVLATIDDDPDDPEVLVKIAGAIVGLQGDGSTVSGFPLPFSDDNQSATFSPSPAVADVDGDGDVEFAVASVSGRVAFFDEARPQSADVAYWPTFQHDVRNTCLLRPGDPADVNGDGMVDVLDLIQVILDWGPCPDPPLTCPADVDGNGVVDVLDLVAVILGWGT